MRSRIDACKISEKEQFHAVRSTLLAHLGVGESSSREFLPAKVVHRGCFRSRGYFIASKTENRTKDEYNIWSGPYAESRAECTAKRCWATGLERIWTDIQRHGLHLGYRRWSIGRCRSGRTTRRPMGSSWGRRYFFASLKNYIPTFPDIFLARIDARA